MPGPPIREGYNAKARKSTAGSRKKGKVKRNKNLTQGETENSNAEIIVPKSQEAKDQERAKRMLEELQAQTESNWTSKKRKRLEKYIEKKLKKEERLETLEKLAKSQATLPSSALQSSSTLGTGRPATHQELQDVQEDKETRTVIRGHGRRKRSEQFAEVSDEEEDEDDAMGEGDATMEEAVIQNKRPASASPQPQEPSRPAVTETYDSAPVVGSALQRNPDGTVKAPIVRSLSKRTKQRSWVRRKVETPAYESESSFDSSDSAYDSSEGEGGSEEDQASSGDDAASGSEEDDEPSEPSEAAPEPVKKKSLGFKDWALKQMSTVKGWDTEPQPLATETDAPPPKKRQRVEGPMRGPLGEEYPLPEGSFTKHLLDPSRSREGIVKTVLIQRTPEVEASRILLPIVTEEQPIMEAVLMNPVVIICGETGSGKTTQLPQFLYEAGFGTSGSENPGMIGITQPRRVAAVSMAARVAHELALTSSKVSYQIRYDATVSPSTSIKFMTDGVLLRELATDFLLAKYSVIIVDEAHERSMNTDILIGVLSRVIKLREQMWKDGEGDVKPLRLIIMSATLRVSDFAENTTLFPSPPPVISVAARQHPVTIHFSRRTYPDYVTQAIKKATKIHTRLPPGGILIFLTGQNEISGVCRKLEAKFGKEAFDAKKRRVGKTQQKRIEEIWSGKDFEDKRTVAPAQADIEAEEIDLGDIQDDLAMDVDGEAKPYNDDPDALDSDDDEIDEELGLDEDSDVPMHIVPLYSLLSSDKQMKVFEPPPPGHRLVVVSTNIAETSLTIPGIRYVVDCGRAKERQYDIGSGVQTFSVSWISKASAAQRAGRAGRTGPGHCYRLYSSAIFENHFEKFANPEIQRIPIEGVVLQMKSMHIDTVAKFPFPTPPDRLALRKAERTLMYLGALKQPGPTAAQTEGQITPLGLSMALFPLSPRFARMLVSGQQHGCLPYVICIVSALSVGDPFLYEESLGIDKDEEAGEEESPSEEKQKKQALRKSFHQSRQIHSSFGRYTSDVFKVLSVVGAYEYAGGGQGFCSQHFVRPKAMEEIHKLRAQISNIVNLNFPQADPRFEARLPPPNELQFKSLRQLLTAAFIDQVAVRKDILEKDGASGTKYVSSRGVAYRAIGIDEDVFIHPSSLLADRPPPDYVLFEQMVRTSRVFIKGLTVVNPAWLWALGKDTICTASKPVKNNLGVPIIIPRYGSEGWELPPMKAPS